MGSSGSILKLSDGIIKNLQGKLDRTKALQSFLNRNVYAMYQDLQEARWMTEGASEGSGWEPLKPGYAKYKAKKYGSFVGSGTKMLIREFKLLPSVMGPGDGFKKVVTNESFTISTGIEYAQWVDQKRSFTKWSDKSMIQIYSAITDFVWHNIFRGS